MNKFTIIAGWTRLFVSTLRKNGMIFDGNHLDLSSGGLPCKMYEREHLPGKPDYHQTEGGCPAKCMSVNQAAKMLIRDGKVDEGILNRIEMAVRAYDP